MPEVKILPTGFSYITRVYGLPSLVEVENRQHELPDIFLGGQVTRQSIRILPRHKFHHFGIEWKPAGIYKLFKINMSRSANNFLDVASLIPKKAYEDLYRVFSKDYDFENQCNQLDQFLLEKQSTSEKCPKIDQALQIINEEINDVSINEIAKSVFLSPRQLRRNIKKICGITPQAYQNIVQMNQIYKLIEQEEYTRLEDLAYQCGYFDVSHFINSFKKRMNSNPSVYLESDDSFISTYIKHSKR